MNGISGVDNILSQIRSMRQQTSLVGMRQQNSSVGMHAEVEDSEGNKPGSRAS